VSAPARAQVSVERAGAGRIPDAFVIGQLKSGTTALYEMLRQHPQVHLPDRKEPRFFAEEMYHRDPPRPGGTPQTLQEYMSWFADARPDQLVVDTSPSYLWSRTAAARIAAVRPDARIVAIVREPASMVRSLHLELVQLYVETETDLRRAVALEGPRREGRHVSRHTYWPKMLQYAEFTRYVQQLSRYRERFGPAQVLVLVYDDFRQDNRGTLRTVLRFLGVDEDFPIAATEANPSVRVRSQRLHELVHAVSVGHGPISRAVKASLKAAMPRGVRQSALQAAQQRLVFDSPPPPDERLMAELRRRFAPEVVALSEYLERDLVSLWGYDRLA
jgi:hypothetical protein